MRKSYYLLISQFITTIFYAQECHFIGIYKTGEEHCANFEIILEDIPVSESQKRYIDFKKEHPGIENTRSIVKLNESAIVYTYKKNYNTYNCYPTIYVVIKAPTIEDCKKELEKRIENQNKKGKASEYYNQPKIIAEYQGKPSEKSDTPKAVATTLNKDYNGVKSMFKIVSKDNRKLIVTQFKNANQKYAVVILKLADGSIEKIQLRPKETLTKGFQTDRIEIQVELLEKQNEKLDLSTINYVKEKVRETIINNNGVPKADENKPTSLGQRG